MYKIMIVEDDATIAHALAAHLERWDYETRCVEDFKNILGSFAEFDPQLVLLDIMLPKMDGWQVCREIRKTSSVPIIMLSAKGETFDKVLGLELGADDYVTKPFEAKEVMARIKAVLRRVKGDNDNAGNDRHNGFAGYNNLVICKFNCRNGDNRSKSFGVCSKNQQGDIL